MPKSVAAFKHLSILWVMDNSFAGVVISAIIIV